MPNPTAKSVTRTPLSLATQEVAVLVKDDEHGQHREEDDDSFGAHVSPYGSRGSVVDEGLCDLACRAVRGPNGLEGSLFTFDPFDGRFDAEGDLPEP